MKLFLVRHGETAHNVERRIQGPLLDDVLNARGVEQARAVEERFAEERAKGVQLAAVYSSPLKRAWMTAEAVARGAGVAKVMPLPAMIEFSWGVHLGKTESGETLAAMKEAHGHWSAGRVDFEVEGGESPARAWQRAKAGLFPVFEAHKDDSIAVVAHGRINKIVLAHLVHQDLSRMDAFGQGNTSVTLLEHAPRAPWDAGWRAVYVNDKAHLARIGEGTAAADGGGPLV